MRAPLWIERHKRPIVALLYGVTSISITLVNKVVLSSYSFNFPNTLTLGQLIISLLLLNTFKYFNLITLQDLSWSMTKKVFPLALFFCLMVVTGLMPLYYVSVPMYGALRRVTTLLVILGEFIFIGKTAPPDEILTVVGMVFGALVAGMGDFSFSLIGYLEIGVNCVITALYLVTIAKKAKETQLGTLGLMFYNSTLSLPPICVLVLLTEPHIVDFPHLTDPVFMLCFILSGVQAFFLNYFIFLCSTINSPLTTSVTGQLKAILTTIFGLFLFNDDPSALLLIGLLISSSASIFYSIIKFKQMQKPTEGVPKAV